MPDHSTLGGQHSSVARDLGGSTPGLTPNFVGEISVDAGESDDTGGRILYLADGTTSGDWNAITFTTTQRSLAPEIWYPSTGNLHGTTDASTTWAWGPYFAEPGGNWTNPLVVVSSESRGNTAADHGTYIQQTFADDAGSAAPHGLAGFTLYVVIPDDFSTWSSAGIRLEYKLTTNGATEDVDVRIEVMDPADMLAWATPKITTVTKTAGTTDSTYQTDLQITGATLNASGTYSAGDVMKLVVGVDPETGTAGESHTIRWGRVELHWSDV